MAARFAQFTDSWQQNIATRSIAHFYVWILVGLVILYISTFPIFKSVILVLIPVFVAGWFYYRRGGKGIGRWL